MNWMDKLMGRTDEAPAAEAPDVKALQKRISDLTKRNESLQTQIATTQSEYEKLRIVLAQNNETLARTRQIILETLRSRAAKASHDSKDPSLGPAARQARLAVAEELELIAEGWTSK